MREVRPTRRRLLRRTTRGLCRLVLLGTVPVVVARAVGGEQKTPLVELAVLVPFAVVAGLVALVAALAVRARWTALSLALLVAVQAVWLAPTWGIGVRTTAPAAGAGEVRVLTLNTLTGFADIGQIVGEVRRRRVDLLVLVEITPTMEQRLEAAGLARDLPHRLGEAQWGADGTMVWSRWPFTPAPEGEFPPTVYGQPRGVVQLPSGLELTVTAVHTLSPIPGRVQRWRADMATLERGLAEVTGPQLVIGDLNATRDHRPFRRLLDAAGLVDVAEVVGVRGGAWPGFTWPANRPLPPVMRLDHVLVSPEAIAVRAVDRVTVEGTDHMGVFAVLVA